MLLATFLLTIFVDLITGIAVGVVLGGLRFLHQMAESVEVADGRSSLAEVADNVDSRKRYNAGQATNRDVMVYQISGAFFFGATARVSWASLSEWEHRGCLCWISRTSR